MKKAKKVSNISALNMSKRLNDMKTDDIDVSTRRVFISPGNIKLGSINSVSLRPVLDCGNCKSCMRKCYDVRNDCVYKNVRDTRANNAAIYLADPVRYFDEISTHCRIQRAFRWHVGGDIKDDGYLAGMVRVANETPYCQHLVFTKMFSLVNEYLDQTGGVLPNNLQICFSGWPGQKMDNPYNLPVTYPHFVDDPTPLPENAKICGNSCTYCLINKIGCWNLKRGETLYFIGH